MEKIEKVKIMKIYNKVKEVVLDFIDLIKIGFKEYFVATDTDPELVRKKHKRIGFILFSVIIVILVITIVIGESIDRFKAKEFVSTSLKSTKKSDISKLASGMNNEQIWLETATQELNNLKQQQSSSLEEQDSLKKYITGETISKQELDDELKQLKSDIEKKYSQQLEDKLKELQQNSSEQVSQESPIGLSTAKPKVRFKRIGEYIPAGSYVEASMISGVDAGVGVGAAEDPRQVLLRITGKAISAGFGKDYLTTNVLMGCLVQCQAVGDLSSEKVYLKPVVMTCAKSFGTVIEMPVKGYVTASGKNGIRGEVVSREGDLVAKSFFSGLVGGIGSGASQYYQPNFALSSGVAVKQGEQASNILGSGLGSGLNQSSSRLSDYLIKRAEQYQPVISINEGTTVNLVFQEGFSLNEEEIKREKNTKS